MQEYEVITDEVTVKGKTKGEKVMLDYGEAVFYLANRYVKPIGSEEVVGVQEVHDAQVLSKLDEILIRLDEPIETIPGEDPSAPQEPEPEPEPG